MPGQGRLGDKTKVSQDAHGCPGCPHPGVGPAISGSPTVFVNGLPALRVDDVGIHAVCCGPNMWSARQGSSTVFINGRAAYRKGDPSKHCGGDGELIEGSSDVLVGDASGGGGGGGGGGGSGGSGGSGGGGSRGGGGGGSSGSGGGSAAATSGSGGPAAAAPGGSGSPAAGGGATASDPAAVRADQIEVELLNPGATPQRHVQFELTLPDGSRHDGDSAADGVIRVSGLTATGQARLLLPKVTADDKRPADAADQEIIPYRTAGVDVPIGQRSRVEIPTRAYRGRLTGMFFEINKSFLLPTAMAGIRGLTDYYEDHKGAPILVVGHTDTQADNAYNLDLSVERADSIAAFLKEDVAQWMVWFGAGKPAQKRWGVREVQHMLSALPDGKPPFFTPPITGVADPRTKNAVSAFQQSVNDQKGPTLPVDGNHADEATRRELVTAYMALEGTTLPAEIPTPVTHGCGPFHNEVPTGPGVDEPRNRRVEVFLFDGEISPPPQKCKAPGCKEYQKWKDQLVETIDLKDAPIKRQLTVTLEWPEEVVDQLPPDTVVRLTGGGIDEQRALSAAKRADGMVHLEFHDLHPDVHYDLVATAGSKSVPLWAQQTIAADDPDGPTWDRGITELISVSA